jgi:hypothetical protein
MTVETESMAVVFIMELLPVQFESDCVFRSHSFFCGNDLRGMNRLPGIIRVSKGNEGV